MCVWILLMCELRAHNSISFLEKILSGIEKILTTFSIPNKIFLKTDLLMYATHTHTRLITRALCVQ